jgi:hypothetical protein
MIEECIKESFYFDFYQTVSVRISKGNIYVFDFGWEKVLYLPFLYKNYKVIHQYFLKK